MDRPKVATCINHPDRPAMMQIGPKTFVCLDEDCVKTALDEGTRLLDDGTIVKDPWRKDPP